MVMARGPAMVLWGFVVFNWFGYFLIGVCTGMDIQSSVCSYLRQWVVVVVVVDRTVLPF